MTARNLIQKANRDSSLRAWPNSDGFGRPLFFQCLIDAAAAILGLALILAIAGSIPVLFVLTILLMS
jgi:hypothetical protein